jgi:glycosyltransferase involved in cell wall biosynthesis
MTLASVFNQNFRDWEIVISNNCSKDGTTEMVQKITDARIRLLQAPRPLEFEENVRNAVDGCRGEYLILLSDDDLLMPEYLSEMVRAFNESPQVTVGLGRRVLINASNQAVYIAPDCPAALVDGEAFLEQFFAEDQSNLVNTIFSLFCRRAQWLQVGGLPQIPAAFYSDTIASSTTASAKLDQWRLGAEVFWQQVKLRAPAWASAIGAERWARLEPALARYIAKHYASRIHSAVLSQAERDQWLQFAEQYPPPHLR